MSPYKRFLIPLKGGRLLAERLQDGTFRLTLLVKQMAKKPLDLWLFDKNKAYRYPKTMYFDKAGNIVLRQTVKDTGLDEVRCACLTDNEQKAENVGYLGEKIDWQGILHNGGKAKDNAEETVSAEEFKEQVRGMVGRFDEQLKPDCQACQKQCTLPDDAQWQEIDLNRLAQHKRLRHYARNPFVSEECKKYDHLIMAETDKFCYLGVPCTPEERYLGRSQGFRMCTDRNGVNYCILKCEK